MAHGTLIGGTSYSITGGRCLVEGTEYAIKKGQALVDGTGYDVVFAMPTKVVVKGNSVVYEGPFEYKLATVSVNGAAEITSAKTYNFDAGVDVSVKLKIVNEQASKTGHIKVDGVNVASAGRNQTATYTLGATGKTVQVALSYSEYGGGYYGNITVTTE